MPDLLCCPGDGFHFEDLVAVADAMLVPSSGEVPTTAIAWAMAAGVPVLATAVYATAEMMADKHNGLLVKPGHPKRAALRLVARLDDREQLDVIKETARGQAFQIFGLTRYVDQHVRLYENILNSHSPAEGIVDSSLDL
jgi:glycosyltransferase involved in cell wall biosynthesis